MFTCQTDSDLQSIRKPSKFQWCSLSKRAQAVVAACSACSGLILWLGLAAAPMMAQAQAQELSQLQLQSQTQSEAHSNSQKRSGETSQTSEESKTSESSGVSKNSETVDTSSFSPQVPAKNFEVTDVLEVSPKLAIGFEKDKNSQAASKSQSDVDSNKEQELYRIPEIPSYTIADIKAFSLPTMQKVTRPSSVARFLSKSEQRFCYLYQGQLVEDPRLVNRHCLDSSMVYRSNLELDRYIFLLKTLALFRGKYELGLTDAEYNEVLDVAERKSTAQRILDELSQGDGTAEGQVLSKEQDLRCFQLKSLALALKEQIYVGFPLERANQIVALHTEQCAGRLSHAEQLLAETSSSDLTAHLQPLIEGMLFSTVEELKPKSYLFPFEGTEQERKKEVLEAQEYLHRLGYLDAHFSGVEDTLTIMAMADFENDQGLVQTGKVSFSNLIRLRLYSIGYEPKFLLPQLEQAE